MAKLSHYSRLPKSRYIELEPSEAVHLITLLTAQLARVALSKMHITGAAPEITTEDEKYKQLRFVFSVRHPSTEG